MKTKVLTSKQQPPLPFRRARCRKCDNVITSQQMVQPSLDPRWVLVWCRHCGSQQIANPM